nr:hypothetical protein [Candidatus Njordarchaeum guaymaensis]
MNRSESHTTIEQGNFFYVANRGEGIFEFARGKLALYKAPKEIESRKEVPTSLVGKVLRRPLSKQEKKITNKV